MSIRVYFKNSAPRVIAIPQEVLNDTFLEESDRIDNWLLSTVGAHEGWTMIEKM